jgi:hypothetical protein
METRSTEIQIIEAYVKQHLQILTDVAYPDSLLCEFPEKLSGYEVFEKLLPNLAHKIAQVIYNDTFDMFGLVSSLHAIKIKEIIAKKYAHIQKIIGEARFNKYVNFPEKIHAWKSQGLDSETIKRKFVESTSQLYLTAARRDTGVFESELLPLVRESLKTFIFNQFPEVSDIDNVRLDQLARTFLKQLDLGRAPIEAKELIKDIQTYCLIIFFINQSMKLRLIDSTKESIATLNVIRTEIVEICDHLGEIGKIQMLIIKNMINLGIIDEKSPLFEKYKSLFSLFQ